jgi:hypothetical protein
MNDKTFIEILRQTFLEADPDFRIDDIMGYEKLGIRMVEKYQGVQDPRNTGLYSRKNWAIGEPLATERRTQTSQTGRWDMSDDGECLCFRLHSNCHYLLETEKMEDIEVEWATEPPFTPEEEAARRQALLDTLIDLLVVKMMPFNRLFTGELETEHGVHLRMFQKGMHMHMRYKPRYGDVKWVANQVLPWGSSVGWDLTMDGRIAVCRVNYDEYYNFLIQPLNDEQVSFYRRKYGLKDRNDMPIPIENIDPATGLKMINALLRLLDEDKEHPKKTS